MKGKPKRYILVIISLLVISATLWGGFSYYIQHEQNGSESVETRGTGGSVLYTQIEVIPRMEEPTSSSNSYADLVIRVSVINEDKNSDTMYDVRYEMNIQYNATFEILNVTKGTFNNAVKINSTAVRFNATEIAHGSNRTGEVWNRVSISSTVRNDNSIKITYRKLPEQSEIQAESSESIGSGDDDYDVNVTVSISFDTVKAIGSKIGHFFKSLWEKIFETEAEAAEIPEIPEFPLGEPIALAVGIVITYLYLKRKKHNPSACA